MRSQTAEVRKKSAVKSLKKDPSNFNRKNVNIWSILTLDKFEDLMMTYRLLTVSMSTHTVGTLLLQCW